MLSVVYFFIPLPEPLGVPNEWIIRLLELPPPFGDRTGVRHQIEGGLHRTMVGSLLFRQIEHEFGRDTLQWDRSEFIAADLAFPSSDSAPHGEDYGTMRGSETDPGTQIHGWRTVVEAAIFCEPNANEEDLSEAFDYCIEQLRSAQQMYYMVSQIPITLVTREALPMILPAAIRNFDEEILRPTGPVERVGYLVNDGLAAVARITLPDELPMNNYIR